VWQADPTGYMLGAHAIHMQQQARSIQAHIHIHEGGERESREEERREREEAEREEEIYII